MVIAADVAVGAFVGAAVVVVEALVGVMVVGVEAVRNTENNTNYDAVRPV